MDALSLVVGVLLGAVIAWASLNASAKQREANNKLSSAKKAQEEKTEKAKKAKDDTQAGYAALMQSFLWSVFGIGVLIFFVIILVGTAG